MLTCRTQTCQMGLQHQGQEVCNQWRDSLPYGTGKDVCMLLCLYAYCQWHIRSSWHLWKTSTIHLCNRYSRCVHPLECNPNQAGYLLWCQAFLSKFDWELPQAVTLFQSLLTHYCKHHVEWNAQTNFTTRCKAFLHFSQANYKGVMRRLGISLQLRKWMTIKENSNTNLGYTLESRTVCWAGCKSWPSHDASSLSFTTPKRTCAEVPNRFDLCQGATLHWPCEILDVPCETTWTPWVAAGMHPEVAEVPKGKRICLWQEMLQAIDYSDMGVVHELMGSHFVGSCEPTGLWPKKFSHATMTVVELFNAGSKEQDAPSHCHSGVGDYDVQLVVWQQP